MSDVITLSSDDELESPPPKRLKLKNEEFDVFKKLNKLKEITTGRCEDSKISRMNVHEENQLTIVIESAGSDTTPKKTEIIDLIDESFEESTLELKENTASSECLIVASDSESEDPLKEENAVQTNGHTNDAISEPDILNRPSTSKASDAHKLLDEFLETCAKSLKGSKYESRVLPKFPKMKNNFHKCDKLHDEHHFKKMIQEHIVTARICAPEAVVSFQRLYSYLLDHISGTTVDVTKEELVKLRKLEKTCRVLLKKIKKLEQIELDFDDEEDSSYMQIDRYTQRLVKVYAKYCQLLKRNPHAGRISHDRVHFVSSRFNEINRAICKSCKDNKFPSYKDIEKCVRKTVSKHNLSLTESDILLESKDCFEKLGNLLQMRRKKELYEGHCGFIALNEDPATKDEDLKKKLQESAHENEKRLKEVVEKFVKLQENNLAVELSEDSDDSHYKDSDSDSKEDGES